MHWPHRRRWQPVSVYHYDDTSFNREGSPSTVVTVRCETCGYVDPKILYAAGYVTFTEGAGASE